MTKEEYKDIYDFVGAAMEVHATLGRGLAEAVYQEATSMELADRGLIAEREKMIPIFYKGKKMEKVYIADFFYKGIIIEMKSVEEVCPEHRAQLFNYMRLCKAQKGILINFGEKSLRAERYIYQSDTDDFILLNKDNYKNYIDATK